MPAAPMRSRKATDEWHQHLLDLFQQGHTVEQACQVTGKSVKTYEWHRTKYPEFAKMVDAVREARRRGGKTREVPDFPDFCRQYLGHDVYDHHLQWIDLLEDREPRFIHPAITFERGESDLLVFNTPPEHAKSTIITMDYVTWRIIQDPNIRVLVVSKTQQMAKKFLYGIKTRLTHPRYRKIALDFSSGGFKDASASWTADLIYLSDDERDTGEKDPTVQALGIGGQIYGARADLIILDDCVVNANAHEFDKQIHWISTEVQSRVTRGGKLLVVGTRMATRDLYSEIRDETRYPDGVSPWTYLAQPAVLEFAEDSKDWLTLWPYADMPSSTKDEPLPDGRYAKWTGPELARRRNRMSPRTWSMVYQQQQVADDATFSPDAVRGVINGMRTTGPLVAGAPGHPRNGGEGMFVVAGCDPAAVGDTAFVVVAVDRATRKRYVLDAYARPAMTPGALKDTIRSLTDRYNVNEWRIEKNAFQGFLVYDEELRAFCNSRGAVITAHFTGSNKLDPDLGVASLSTLFDGHEDGRALIDLPSTKQNESVKLLVEELITWSPQTKGKTDLVMALWFTEIRTREVVNASQNRYHVKNEFLSARDRENQVVLRIDDYLAAQQNRQQFAAM